MSHSNVKMTSYLIARNGSAYSLKCVDGPHKLGLKDIVVEDEPSLIEALIGLGAPEGERARALQELRSEPKSIITFDARLR